MPQKLHIVGIVIALAAIFIVSTVASAAPAIQQPIVRTVWESTPKDTVGPYTTTSSTNSVKVQFTDLTFANTRWVQWASIVVTDDGGKSFRVVSVPIDQPGYRFGFVVSCVPVMAQCSVSTITPTVGNTDNPSSAVRWVRYTLRGQGVPVGVQFYTTSLAGKEAEAAKVAVAKLASTANKMETEAASVAFNAADGDIIPLAVIGTTKRGCNSSDSKSSPGAQDGTCVITR